MTKYILSLIAIMVLMANPSLAQLDITNYVRYSYDGKESYGVLKGESIEELRGDLFSSPQKTGRTLKLSKVKLLPPCNPSKVLAVGLNYKSHIGNRPIPDHLGLFSKYPTCIIAHEEDILMPSDATDLHYEGELVIVIGKKAQKVSISEASDYIFGVTVGNDVSERNWQQIDLQWFRAKASDTFGPIGPTIAQGLNYNDLLLQTRLNGELVQSERTKDLIYSVEEIVSYISKYVTLLPGDVIFTGTPGSTKAMKPNDVVEIELEGVGVLRNKVVMAD
ncbi:MAG: fumarylacetoacetate hydrolase family protein [Bacteroidetes bacterium]|nr:fumarylacetoacetate hydrolase family protein [Bacteroidota bacterium]MDA1122408.1 fumarylacetoacetate hydrolase family protein [Bacteroidota bacterium]